MLKPLLHTWSLSIEEQFYIFPLTVWAIYRFLKLKLINFLFIVFLISLSLSLYGNIYHPHISFFLIPTRAWELLAGALIAQIKTDDYQIIKINSIFFKNFIYLIFMALIFYSILYYDDKFFNKSLFILISVISTSYLIYMEDSKIFVRRILDNSYIVKVGLISYSVYLWHFPIFAIARANDL